MSLLEKILGDENREEKKHPIADEPEQKNIARPAGEEKNDQPAEDPMPCLECWSPTFWRSIYGGELRCAVCDPWPASGLVGERWTLLTLPGDQLAWSRCLRPGEHSRDLPGPDNLVDGFRCVEFEDSEGQWMAIERVA